MAEIGGDVLQELERRGVLFDQPPNEGQRVRFEVRRDLVQTMGTAELTKFVAGRVADFPRAQMPQVPADPLGTTAMWVPSALVRLKPGEPLTRAPQRPADVAPYLVQLRHQIVVDLVSDVETWGDATFYTFVGPGAPDGVWVTEGVHRPVGLVAEGFGSFLARVTVCRFAGYPPQPEPGFMEAQQMLRDVPPLAPSYRPRPQPMTRRQAWSTRLRVTAEFARDLLRWRRARD